MTLSDGEKLILVMLSDIYKHLKIEGNIDPEIVLTSIFNNQTWGLAWEYDALFEGTGHTPPTVSETCNILDMYRLLAPSFEQLSEDDKKRVQTEAQPFADYVKYQGFDGNHDPHLSVVSYLVKTLKRYEEIKHPDLNSHTQATLPHYRRMLPIFQEERAAHSAQLLTADQIIKIVRGGR